MRPDLRTTFALLLLAVVPAAPPVSAQEVPRAPYLTTPTATVQRMLDLVEVTARDTVYDLGSGDGRIPIIAARRHGAHGVGVELRGGLVAEARDAAERAGVAGRVRFVHGDLFDVDLAPATVVTLYLLPSVNLRLRPKLLRELRPGARIVSNGFAMGGWEPDRDVRDLAARTVLYAWIVPARVAGRWRLAAPSGRRVLLEVDQRFQELRARAVPEGEGEAAVRVLRADLEGPRIELSLSLPGAESPVVFGGSVSGDAMRGTTEAGGAWSAERLSGGEGSLERWGSGG